MNILMFSDTGIDDTVAIIYALYHPDIQLKGIVEGYGNVARDKTLRNGHYLMKLAGKEDEIPVISGATGPLNGETPSYFPEIHGEEGLGPIKPPVSAQHYSEQTNYDELFEIIKANKNDLTIVNAGRLTSLATAFNLSPEVMKYVSAYSIMGGAFLVPGNASPVAEANFYGDPLAANIVMAKARNVSLLPLNVTMKAVIRPSMVNFIDRKQTTKIGKIMKPILDFYYKAYQDLVPGIEGGVLHDVVAMCAAINGDRFLYYVDKKVQVDHQGGAAKGLSIADFRARSEDEGSDEEKECIAMEIDYDKFIHDLMVILSKSKIC